MADPITQAPSRHDEKSMSPRLIEEYAKVFYSTLNMSSTYYQNQLNEMVQEALHSVSELQEIALDHLEEALAKHASKPSSSHTSNDGCSKPKSVQHKLDQLKTQHEQQKESNQSQISALTKTIVQENPDHFDPTDTFVNSINQSILRGMENAISAQENAFTVALASTTQAIDLIYTVGGASIASKVALAFEHDPKPEAKKHSKKKFKKK